MRVISRRAIREFGGKYSDAVAGLNAWFKIVSKADWKDAREVVATFNEADVVGEKIVFNIAHNRYRLIAWISYRTHKVLIKAILPHKEYDKGDWK